MKLARHRLAILVVASAALAGGALALHLAEQASATVHRNVPAKAPFSPDLVQRLRVPPGFRVNLFASGLENPRMMAVAPDGTVYVTRRSKDDVLALRDANGDGVAEQVRVFVSGLDGVHGIDVRQGTMYLANSTTVWTTPLAAPSPRVIISGLPDGGQHPNRTVRIGPEGLLYVSVGSSCNDCAEANQLERATMIVYTPDGRQRYVMANGLRNTIGYDWHPRSNALWGMDHGSDFHGDELPPEELNHIKAGGNYGWPICYGAQVVDPMTNAPPRNMALKPGQAEPIGVEMSREAYCAQTEPAALTLPAHSAPMAMRFYTAAMFPPEYRHDAFVALRGSWNRGNPVGYKVVRIRFNANGQPWEVSDFLTGFLNENATAYFGRPTGVAVAADGSLLVGDDTNGAIYRVSVAR